MREFVPFILLILLFSEACTMNHQQPAIANAVGDEVSLTRPLISSELAVVIGMGHLCFDYNLRNYESSVLDRSDRWEVHFKKQEANGKSYGPVIFISKATGERLYVIHSK